MKSNIEIFDKNGDALHVGSVIGMIKRILELGYDEYKADNVDDAFMAGYHRNQEVSWLKQHRDNIQVAPTIREYFFQKESLRKCSESDDLPF